MKIFLLTYLSLFFLMAFVWRSFKAWRDTGINPYRLGVGDTVHSFLGRLYQFVLLTIIVTVLIYTFAEDIYAYLTPLAWLESQTTQGIGVLLLLVSFVWIIIAQIQMGNSWRIGIDSEHETTLVTRGVFSLSRNPIFLGMRANLLGLFLIMPNAVTLAVWLLGDVLLQIQVRLEEHLLTTQGQQYEQFQRQVRRWL
ncbi:MAG: isoprenylcysteine carboxylmethyltransferase family protein [Anaerolineales bacterium]|nr:isoprenylcysteine carboxylmethyltransferase family protein [Anaerolineales bacterium]